MTLDLAWIRSRFPGLDSPWALLDNAGGSQVLGTVVEAVRAFLLNTNVQLGATYERSRRASDLVERGRDAAASLFGATSPREVVLGPSSTRLLTDLSRSLAASIEPGDEIVVTDADHESNIAPWLALKSRRCRDPLVEGST